MAVLHAALDGGVRLLDTADAYCLDDRELGHNERLVARALATWSGPRDQVRVATTGGLVRPGGAWVPDGRAKHLAAACEASLAALGRIDLYQLHAPDPRTPFRTSVRALAKLQRDGLVAKIGLCNVTVAQIDEARTELELASVQVGVSPFDDVAIRGGVIEHCRAHQIEVLAHRPLGGAKAIAKLAKHPALAAIARKHECHAAEVVLAWLRGFAIVPLPGPTRIETARACASTTSLDDSDRDALDCAFAFADLLRRPRATRRAPPRDDAEIVILMGIPGAGKSTRARELVADGYTRLNRDDEGGTLAKLAAKLDTLLRDGARRVVLDNTYAARSDRNLVVETAWRHRIPVRCVWLDTPIADARINAIERILATHGRLLEPDELKRAPKDAIPPRAQNDFERELEPPSDDEGFTRVERVAFTRAAVARDGPLLVLVDIDRVRPIARLHELHHEGARLVAWAWRPSPAIDRATEERQLAEALGLPITLVTCTHPAGPPTCWCRPPLPGLVRAAMHTHGSAPAHTRMLGADANAERLAIASGIAFERVET
ncbi:MAG TPA: aldo/keto reductase [Nannocystaceae bacterium]|nr:aldo/keto reductase [Nannocystaceae bacterium]